MERRIRLPDGGFGELEKIGSTETKEEQLKRLEQENTLLKARNNALAERTDFHEEVLTEIILTISE